MNGPITSSVALDIVVPCYNEAEALPDTHRQLGELLRMMIGRDLVSSRSRIHYVDDGSQDATWELIESLCRTDAHVVGIRLSRNFGHQSAVLAGLFTAKGDAVITIDADLQDDISVIPEMVEKFRAGDQIVYGVRKQRTTDTVFKRQTALLHYGLLRQFGARIVHNHGDYRLI